MATGLASTLHFDSRTRGGRATSRLEFAAALAIVVALHVALAVWILRSREQPAPPPEPRTIVARLLTTAPAAPLGVAAAPKKPAPAPAAPPVAPAHPAPAHAQEPPRPARVKPPVAPRPVHRELPAVKHETPVPAPSAERSPPSPISPPEPAAPAQPAQPPTTTAAPSTAPAADTSQHSASAQAPAANAAPKNVSHVDCNIAQPDYPAMAQRRGEAGTAVVRFVVGVDGRVESAKLQQSSGYAQLDDAALGAVHGGTCRPWKEAGVPVRVAYAQPFVFGLRN